MQGRWQKWLSSMVRQSKSVRTACWDMSPVPVLDGAMIFLGDQVGLYRAMDGAGPLTSHQLAERAGLNPRWVQEWLHTQVCAGLLHYDTAHKTYDFPAEYAQVQYRNR